MLLSAGHEIRKSAERLIDQKLSEISWVQEGSTGLLSLSIPDSEGDMEVLVGGLNLLIQYHALQFRLTLVGG